MEGNDVIENFLENQKKFGFVFGISLVSPRS